MAASFLPPILVPVVTLVFPGLVFPLFFVLIEQEADDCLARRF
jgi:K+-transporting ATPase c subunit